MSAWLSVWAILCHLAQGIPFPGFVLASAPSAPSFVNSVADFCTYGGSTCSSGPNLSVTAGNSLVVYIGFLSYAFTTCGTGGTVTAALSGGASLTQIGSNVRDASTNTCMAAFRINSLPSTTATENVVFTYTGTGYASVGMIQTTSFSTEDANCSGTNDSTSPTTCASGMTVSSDILTAGYSNFNVGGTIGVGGGFTGAALYVGANSFTPILQLAYRQVTSSGTYNPSISDTGSLNSVILGAATH